MSDIIKNIVEIKKSKSYIAYTKYHQGNIFGITRMSRWELMHSNFIAWALGADSSHALGLYPIYQFVRALSIIQDCADNGGARKLPLSLVYDLFDDDSIQSVSIDREVAVRDKGTTKHVDLVIRIKINDKELPIILENKVNSKENGDNGDQTVTYFNWGEAEYQDRDKYYEPIYVFLYPEYNKTMQSSDKYIRMTYQQLVDYVFEPSLGKCGDMVSIKNYKAYLQCLSFQSDNDKGEYTMAISNEERKILNDFLKENENLWYALLNEKKDDLDPEMVELAPKVLEAITGKGKDYSDYEFDGKTYNKRALVLAMVKKYIKENPTTTHADLEAKFPIVFSFDRKPLIRLKKDVTPSELAKKRVFIDEPITLSDGTEILINNQVGKKDMSGILKIAEDLGYVITPAES